MKKFYLLLCSFLFVVSSISSQPWPYEISSSMQPFNNLVNPVSLNNGNVWSYDSLFTVQLTNFDFVINGIPTTSIDVMAARGLLFNGTFDQFLFGYSTVYGGTSGSLLMDKGSAVSLSPINYEFSGPPGSQILKFEWLNAGFIPFVSTDTSSFASYQIWLFETDDHLEIHYGPNDTSSVLSTPFVFVSFRCYGNYGVYISQDQTNPIPYWTNITQPNYSPLTTIPDNGRVFTISKNPLFNGLNDETETSIVRIYPNPSSDKFQIISKNTFVGTCKIFDSKGRELFQLPIDKNQLIIDMIDYPNGLYFVGLTSDHTSSYQKILKQ